MYDLSIVTDALRDILTGALAASPLFGGGPPPFSIAVSSQHPDTPSGADCDLNLYLFHLCENKHLRNQFWTQQSITGQPGAPIQPIAFEPLCLDLWFLLSAQSEGSYQQEQQAMSVAVRAFHEQPVVRLPTPTPTGIATSEVTLTMETPSPDDLSRLWQALGAPLRMTAEYKASVAMLLPETGAVAHPNPTTWSLLAAPEDDLGETPLLYGTVRRVSFMAPAGARSYDQTPASTSPAAAPVIGQEFILRGRGLLETDDVFLVTPQPDGTETEQDIASWRLVSVGGGEPIVLRPPPTPGECPEPGRYLLRIGRGTLRSNAVPVLIAPWVDFSAGPLLAPDGSGLYEAFAVNVPAAGATVRLGTALLRRITSGAPAAGEWRLVGSNTLRFRPPTGTPPGQYALRLRAADVEADPAVWAVVS